MQSYRMGLTSAETPPEAGIYKWYLPALGEKMFLGWCKYYKSFFGFLSWLVEEHDTTKLIIIIYIVSSYLFV